MRHGCVVRLWEARRASCSINSPGALIDVGGSTMTRLRSARRSSLLAAPILAALSGGLLTAAATLPGLAATQGAASKGEWFRAEPPRSPVDLAAPSAPAAEPS